jgi:hypothetical protein
MLSALRRAIQAIVGLCFFAAGVALGGFEQTVLWWMAAATILGAAA